MECYAAAKTAGNFKLRFLIQVAGFVTVVQFHLLVRHQ